MYLHTTAPGDYISVINHQLRFDPRIQRSTLSISIIDDAVDEAEEEFMASLTLVTTSGRNVQVNPDQTTIKITDDDGNRLLFMKINIAYLHFLAQIFTRTMSIYS